MKRCLIIFLAGALLCVFVAAILFVALLARFDWSLTTADMTVFVNDVENVDDAVCSWSGSQYFDVTHRAARARFYVMVFDESEGELAALINAREAEGLQVESIELRLICERAGGASEEVPLVPIRSPRTESASEWSRSPVVSRFPDHRRYGGIA